MTPFLRRLKFAWDYFVRGRHRSRREVARQATAADWRAGLDWHDDLQVGRYVRTKVGTWWADALLKSLGYEVRLIAPGDGPTAAQMADFEALAARLPGLIAEADLEPIPQNDGWGNAPPLFEIRSARVESITKRADASYWLLFDVAPDGVYMLAPSFSIAQDHTLISAEWSV